MLVTRFRVGFSYVLADIDIDKVYAKEEAGEQGNEQGSDDIGTSNTLIYNIDARSRLNSGDFNKSPSRQSLGFKIVLH